MSKVDQIRKNLSTNPAKETSECLNQCVLVKLLRLAFEAFDLSLT